MKRFLYHLIYFRNLSQAYNSHASKSEFWKYTIDSHICMATIEWCKVFGATGCNPIHWKHLLSDKMEKELQEKFREILYTTTGFDEDSWKIYWDSMLSFRNKYVAHQEPEFNGTVPDFTPALEAVHAYDNWVRILIKSDSVAAPRLKQTQKLLERKIKVLSEKIICIVED